MRGFGRFAKYIVLVLVFGIAAGFVLKFGGGKGLSGLWNGLQPAAAASTAKDAKANYDLTQLRVVNEVLKYTKERYVDPKRVRAKEMLLSALNFVQRDVAQIIVTHEEGSAIVKVRVDTQEREFKVDTVLGPWDVAARLREIFAFVQEGLRGTEVDLREVEYAACNGMLHTLDPHSVLLSPEAYKDMNAQTSGQFGGLGIVISIRDDQLTVMNPMPGTPAQRADIRRLDRITKINNESTLNMGLNEAVQHLRGVPGSKVTVWLHRDGEGGWANSKPFELNREVIKVKSVESQWLDGVGYIRLKQFQANSSAEVQAALASLKKNGEMKGLVLDLRGNPGGLLDQAAKIVDTFVVSGPIVATVGASEGRDEKVAHAEGTEPNYPIALLVSGTSASASEIVAGAMKNHERALIIGETTFGKGSVQLIFNDLPDKAALKLTIAQYLTEPGDISIQGTGVTPDIELDPMTADLQEMDLTVDTASYTKERDLSRSLSNVRIREGQKPTETVRYNLPEKERQELRERGGEVDDTKFNADFPIRFARDLVADLKPGKRGDQLRSAKDSIAKIRAKELVGVSADLQQLGIDWSDAPADVAQAAAGAVPNVEVKLETDRPNNEAVPGEALSLKLTVTNKGTAALYRLNAVSKSDSYLYTNKELVIGKLEPQKSKTVSIPLGYCEVEGHKAGSSAPTPKDAPRTCKIPKDVPTRSDWVSLKFDEARGRAPADVQTQVTVKALQRPVFAYSYQLVDAKKGNGDGRVQKGETITLQLTVKNVGKGKSFETKANLRNLSGDGVLLREGRFDISNMAPGDTRNVVFNFDVQEQLDGNEAKVELSVIDRDLRETIVEKIRMPIAVPTAISAASGGAKAKAQGAVLYESPDASSRAFGKLAAASVAAIMGKSGEFLKVRLGDDRFGFVRTADVDEGGAGGASATFEPLFSRMPPDIEVQIPVLSTREAQIKISGIASDSTRLLDAYIFVDSKKVFYRSNRNGDDSKKMPFEATIPLRPGVNAITVVARETPDTVGRKTFIVRRDGTNGEYVPTPKNDDDGSETGGDDD